MNYVLFNIFLGISDFAATLIFSLCITTLMVPISLVYQSDNRPKEVAYLLIAIGAVFHIYFFGFWAVFCVAIYRKFIGNIGVEWSWLYWITGFIWCLSLQLWLEDKSKKGLSNERANRIQKSSAIYILITIVAFLLFTFKPSYSFPIYNYLLEPLGLKKYLVVNKTQKNYINTDHSPIQNDEAGDVNRQLQSNNYRPNEVSQKQEKHTLSFESKDKDKIPKTDIQLETQSNDETTIELVEELKGMIRELTDKELTVDEKKQLHSLVRFIVNLDRESSELSKKMFTETSEFHFDENLTRNTLIDVDKMKIAQSELKEYLKILYKHETALFNLNDRDSIKLKLDELGIKNDVILDSFWKSYYEGQAQYSVLISNIFNIDREFVIEFIKFLEFMISVRDDYYFEGEQILFKTNRNVNIYNSYITKFQDLSQKSVKAQGDILNAAENDNQRLLEKIDRMKNKLKDN